jgi:glutamate synthase (ferredoxin)
VATQSRWLMRGLDPMDKSARLANYLVTLRKELLALAQACGEVHPALVTLDRVEIVDPGFSRRAAREVFGYEAGWGLPAAPEQDEIRKIMQRPAA